MGAGGGGLLRQTTAGRQGPEAVLASTWIEGESDGDDYFPALERGEAMASTCVARRLPFGRVLSLNQRAL